jgi:hypothetical protein
MHRTEADGHITESGLRRHVDRNPPVTGTTLAAEFANAVQEELVNAIVDAGITLNASAAADRTAGWNQLSTAIFNSEAIDTPAIADEAVTNAKIDSVSLSKITNGTLDLDETVGSTDYNLSLTEQWIKFTQEIGTTRHEGFFDHARLILEKKESGITTEYFQLVAGDGIKFLGSSKDIKFISIDISSASWTNVGTDLYSTTFITALPNSIYPLFGIYRHRRYMGSGNYNIYSQSPKTMIFDTYTNSYLTLILTIESGIDPDDSNITQENLTLFYSGS